MEEFIGEFKAESGAIIDTLQGLLLSYAESSSKSQAAEELFRGIHTLKGTSKMFGFDDIETATHQLENILDGHRKENTPFSPELVEIILRTLDFCLNALEHKGNADVLKTVIEKINGYAPATNKVAIGASAIYCVLLKPDADIFERGINILSAFKELNDLGVTNYFPGKKAKSLEDQVSKKKLETLHFDIWTLTTKTKQDIEDVFMFFKPSEFEIIHVTDGSSVNKVFEKLGVLRGKALSKVEKAIRLDFMSASDPSIKSEPVESVQVRSSTELRKEVAETTAPQVKLNYINVPLTKLDQMMNLVSEFVTLSGEVKFYASMMESEGLQHIAERLEKVSSQFRDNAFNMRLVPIQILSIKLQRYVKELSQQLGKKVKFITEGMDTEIDKSIINQIEGPLMHIVRNAIDHGLESPAQRSAKGKSEECILKLSAFYSGTNVFIHIQDDGSGINLDKVKDKAIAKGLVKTNDILTRSEIIAQIFKPGFSTAETTTEISGRGVGLDVVQKNIADLRGSIEVTTEAELGTSFAIRLPLALSIMDVMIVKIGAFNYMIPHSEIEFCTAEIFTDQVQRKGYNLKYRNQLIPLLDPRSLFGEPGQAPDDAAIIILNKNDQHVSIEVDQIVGKEQVVIKPIDETLQIIPYLSGTSILGNGELAFLIDVLKLKELYAVNK
jgi:two-component system chemotaxis sensor kinase CheA